MISFSNTLKSCGLIGLLLLTASSYAKEKDVGVGLLYLMHAETMQITETSDHHFKLHFQPTNHTIYYFSQRPKRLVGQISAEQFLSIWQKGSDSFKNNNPNTALVGLTSDNQPFSNFVILNNPSYDPKTNTYIFDFVRMPDKQKSITAVTLKDATLFIDTYVINPNGYF